MQPHSSLRTPPKDRPVPAEAQPTAADHMSAPDGPDPLWWALPAMFTLLAGILGYVGRFVGPLPFVWHLGYLVPLGHVVALWFLARSRERRGLCCVLGVSACLYALIYGKAVMAVAYALALVSWLKNGD
ncbi:hypothetical protein [Streptomyces sp. NPDC054863]